MCVNTEQSQRFRKRHATVIGVILKQARVVCEQSILNVEQTFGVSQVAATLGLTLYVQI